MQRGQLILLAATVLMLNGCSDSDSAVTPDSPAAQHYSVSLTQVTVVKQGSNEELTIDGLPANGATLTGN